MQKLIVFFVVALTASIIGESANAAGFEATLSGTLVNDIGDDGFGAGDTVEYRLPLANAGTINSGGLAISFNVPEGSTISAIRGYTSYAAEYPIFSITMGENPGDWAVIVNFSPPPFAMEETAAVLFQLTVTDSTTLSMTGRLSYAAADFSEITDYTNTVVYSEGMRTIDTADELIQELTGTLGATLLYDANFYGALETGEALTYAAVITNTGDTLSKLIIRATLDHNTQLIAGSVIATEGEVVFGNGESDDRVEVLLYDFAAGATAAIAYAVTVAAQVTDGTQRIRGAVTVAEGASEKPLLQLVHEFRYGPAVRLIAEFTSLSAVILSGPEDYSYGESITIRNDGPVAVTGITIAIKPIAEAPTDLLTNASATMTYPLTPCTAAISYFCKEDGAPYCPDQRDTCVAAPGVEHYAHEVSLAVGQSFVIKWTDSVKAGATSYQWARYQVEITATTLAAPAEAFTVTHRLDRLLKFDALEDSALSPWVSLAALLAAMMLGFRKRAGWKV